MSEYDYTWQRAWPSGHIHLFLFKIRPLCGINRTYWTPQFPPGARRCPRCFTMAGLPLVYEGE